MTRRAWYLTIAALVMLLALAACGGESESVDGDWSLSLDEYEDSWESEEYMEEAEVMALRGAKGAQGPAGAPGPISTAVDTPMPRPASVPTNVSAAVKTEAVDPAATLAMAVPTPAPAAMAAPEVQTRMIVRTVDMALTVGDLAGTLQEVQTLAEGMDGWVVQSSRQEDHRAFISVRVPAQRVDETMGRLRELATKVDSEVSSSRDVTDEYVDHQSRLRNLAASEEQLLELLGQTAKVEELLLVQQELSKVRGQIEEIEGRIKLLEETVAFSLINVSLELEPAAMKADAGEDRTASLGEPVRFRAEFTAPEGIEDFRYEWDFGDGSGPVAGSRTVPNADGVTRSTATVTHFYEDETDSPFIVTFEITGTGEAGVAEGEDTLTVVVTRLPRIDVFAGRDMTVDEGDSVRFSGSFTRPEEMSQVSYKWEFGDGSSPVTGTLEAGDTTAEAVHTYANERPTPFTATLTVTGTGDAGTITSKDSTRVLVLESPGWSPGGISGDAVGALGAIGRGLGSAAIWAGILSPIWALALAGAAYVAVRRRRGSSK